MNMHASRHPTPLRQRMIDDMIARGLGPASQRSHLRACTRFAGWLGRSPDTATPDDVKRFQQHLIESGASVCVRNQTMTGVKFLCRVTLRRQDLVSEIFHLKAPHRIPLVLSQREVERLLAMAPDLRSRVIPLADALHRLSGKGSRSPMAVGYAPTKWSNLGSVTLTALKRSSGSSSRKARRIATSCCRRRSWICCAAGGGRDPITRTLAFQRRGAGCFRAGSAGAIA